MGLPRRYFYQRIAEDLDQLLSVRQQQEMHSWTQEETRTEMVTKVNIQEAIGRLKFCPVCGGPLGAYPTYPLEKSCECGDFLITEVYADGDVAFEYKMVAPEKLEAENGPADTGP